MKIGLYGGTFNPVHLGHIGAARFAVEYLRLDKLLLIPAGIPPHKQMDAGTPVPRCRLEMAALAAEAVGPRAEALDIELRREGKSYTLDTVEAVRKMYPGASFYLLMGTDMFLTFHLWKDPEKIAKRCTLCAFGRSEKDTEELFAVQRAYLWEALGAEAVTIVLPHIVDVSSTWLRERLAVGKGREYLDRAVYGYILREGLYGVKRDLGRLSLDELRDAAVSMLRRRRIPHVLGTEETAARLARTRMRRRLAGLPCSTTAQKNWTGNNSWPSSVNIVSRWTQRRRKKRSCSMPSPARRWRSMCSARRRRW